MAEVRGASMARLLTVIIAAVAWFLISNHCVLAEFKEASNVTTSCHQPCCGNPPPAKNKTESAAECCKTLRATFSGAAKELARYDSSLFAPQLYFVVPVVGTHASGSLPVLELDTGPPFVSTFAESVLQRSILAHAPPVVA
jgi:hypothetical protein